jgi:rhamnogalacturonyl hydrolase YesR
LVIIISGLGIISSVLVYAFAKGADDGYLDSYPLEVARKSFEGILKSFINYED